MYVLLILVSMHTYIANIAFSESSLSQLVLEFYGSMEKVYPYALDLENSLVSRASL